MIHEAKCDIVIPVAVGKSMNIMGWGAAPPIPTDAEMEEVFPDWVAKGKIFIGRVMKEENYDPFVPLTPQDLFKIGMKFVITEARNLP